MALPPLVGLPTDRKQNGPHPFLAAGEKYVRAVVEGAGATPVLLPALQPTLPPGDPGMQITVLFSFKRNGEILGKPRITFESASASDADRIAYRTAIMETLQRCAPMPFTDSMGGAIAGRLITFRFDDRRNHPKPTEKRAWLTTTTL